MREKQIFLSKSAVQTQRLARELVKSLLRKKDSKLAPPSSRYAGLRRTGKILALAGELGSGKTTFVQGFARGLGIKERVLSPTFVIMRRYQNFFHIDCYRIQKPKELIDLGLKIIMANPKNIIAIEWAERVEKILPKQTIWIRFDFINKNKRKIVIE